MSVLVRWKLVCWWLFGALVCYLMMTELMLIDWTLIGWRAECAGESIVGHAVCDVEVLISWCVAVSVDMSLWDGVFFSFSFFSSHTRYFSPSSSPLYHSPSRHTIFRPVRVCPTNVDKARKSNNINRPSNLVENVAQNICWSQFFLKQHEHSQ
jgi:hypothetical protein